MISMLREGNSGEEILNILNTFIEESVTEEYKEPTINPIDFWYNLSRGTVPLIKVAQYFTITL